MTNEKENSKGLFIVISILIIAIIIIITIVPFPYKTTEQKPYTATESYTEMVNTKNCDYSSSCSCIHLSWGGLGACDSCRCSRTRSVTKYKTVLVTKSATLLEQWS